MNFQLFDRNQKAIALIIYILSSLIFYMPGFDGKILWGQDSSKISFPFSYFLDQSLKNGKLETWNPYIYFGFPLGAEQGQYGIVYPLNLLHAILPLTLALTLLGIIHFTIAGFTTYLYCRFLKLNFLSGIFAGLAYMFNGFIISHAQYPSHIYAYAWLPLILLLIGSGIKKFSISKFLSAGALLGLQLLSGHPNIFFITLIGSSIYLMFIGYHHLIRLIKAILLLSGSLIIVALPYIWQLKTLLPLSNRADGVSFLDATNSSVHFFDLINFISPHFFFTNLNQSWHYSSVWHRFAYWGQIETTGFVGIVTLALSIISINKHKIKEKLPLFGVLIISLLIAFGRNTYVYENIFFKLPILNGLRAPGKFLLLTDFCLAILAAYGIDYLFYLRKIKKINIHPIRIIAVFVIFIFGILWIKSDIKKTDSILVSYVQDIYAQDGFFSKKEEIPELIQKSVLHHATFPLLISFILLFTFLIYGLCKKKKILYILPVILIAEMFYFIKPINLWVSWIDLLHQKNETINYLETKLGDQYRVYTYTDFWSDLLPNQLVPHQLREANGFSSLYLNRFSNWQNYAAEDKTANLYRMGSIKYIYHNYELTEIKNTLPRLFIATSWHQVDDELQALQAITTSFFDPATPVVETSINFPYKQDSTKIIPLKFENDSNSKLKIIINDSPGGLLVLNDTNYPGWIALVDGKITPIMQTNYLFKGIFLSPGEHDVEFKYNSSSWFLTIGISWFYLITIFSINRYKLKSFIN